MKKSPGVAALFSLKGGVGKTTTAVSLAYLAAESGVRTLLWDLDPQGAASYCLRVKPSVAGGASALLGADEGLRAHIRATDYPNLDLMPADFSYRKLDAMLARQKKPRALLGRALEQLVGTRLGRYGLVVLDCPPGPSLVSESVFRMADLLVVPMIPTPLSLRAQVQLEVYCVRRRFPVNRIVPFFSMVDRRKGLHRQTLEAWAQSGKGGAVKAAPGESTAPGMVSVPYAAQVENMAMKRVPFPQFGGSTPAGVAMRELWERVAMRLRLDTRSERAASERVGGDA